jgi:hypothetical protein
MKACRRVCVTTPRVKELAAEDLDDPVDEAGVGGRVVRLAAVPAADPLEGIGRAGMLGGPTCRR